MSCTLQPAASSPDTSAYLIEAEYPRKSWPVTISGRTPSSWISVPSPMPSACTPIRLISLLNSQRASYSRNPVAFTIGSDSKADVLGRSTAFGFGNIRASSGTKELVPQPISECAGKGEGWRWVYGWGDRDPLEGAARPPI